MDKKSTALNRLRKWATLASRIAAGASMIIAAWYTIAMLGIELPEPGAIQPFHPAYIDVRLTWALLLAIAYFVALKHATPLLLLLAAAPNWVLVIASLVTVILHRKKLIDGLLWALLGLEALALCEQVAVLLGLRPYGLFTQVEKTLRLTASTATLPLLIALILLAPFKYIEHLAKRRSHPAGGWKGRPQHLLPAIALSVAVAYMPYLPTVNPSAKLVGVDPVHYYIQWIQELNVNFTLTRRLRERPLFVLLTYSLSKVMDTYWAMRTIQLLCFVSYTIATYYFTLWLTGEKAARLAALLFPISYTATVLIHSGYYNNILASSLSLPALAIMERWLWSGSIRMLILGITLYEAAVLTHPHSTLFYAVALGGTAILRRGKRRSLVILAIAAAFAAQSEFMSMGFGEKAAIQTLKAEMPLSLSWAQTMAFVACNCAINAALDTTMWILATIGLALVNNGLLISTAAAASMATLLAPSWMHKWRAIYAMPLMTYQAIVLRETRSNVKALVLLLLANYMVSYICNIS